MGLLLIDIRQSIGFGIPKVVVVIGDAGAKRNFEARRTETVFVHYRCLALGGGGTKQPQRLSRTVS